MPTKNGGKRTATEKRLSRLQVMLSQEELTALDNFRFEKRMPSRASAIREILRRGLAADGFAIAVRGSHSKAFGVLRDGSNDEG
ncbi:MAG: hypothetical protein AB7H70_03615 [Rhodospirillaceae bacterium]